MRVKLSYRVYRNSSRERMILEPGQSEQIFDKIQMRMKFYSDSDTLCDKVFYITSIFNTFSNAFILRTKYFIWEALHSSMILLNTVEILLHY